MSFLAFRGNSHLRTDRSQPGFTSWFTAGRFLMNTLLSDEVSVKSVNRNTDVLVGFPMNCYPASEQRISEIERGRSCNAVVALPTGGLLTAGDSILFALSNSRAGQQPSFVKGGDSVLVLLTSVTNLESIDPITGQSLVELSWDPLGQTLPTPSATKRVAKRRTAQEIA